MGRSIPSATARMDGKLAQWERFSRMLPPQERQAFLELVSHMRNRRSAIDAADEADIGVAMLLAAIVRLRSDKGSEWLESGSGQSTLK